MRNGGALSITIAALVGLVPRVSLAQHRPAAHAMVRPSQPVDECHRCLMDARACLHAGDMACARAVLAGCRECNTGSSTVVPRDERHIGVPEHARYWSGARGEPSRAYIDSLQPVLRDAVRACAGYGLHLGAMDEWPWVEVVLMPWGSFAWARIPVPETRQDPACLLPELRRRGAVPPTFQASYPVVLRFDVRAFVEGGIGSM